MKVRELINKVHLVKGQHTKLNDVSSAMTYTTVDRYEFDFCSDEVERLMNLKVNSFTASADGITIWAEEIRRSR